MLHTILLYTLSMGLPAVQDAAPPLEVPAQSPAGRTTSLEEMLKDGPVVVTFFPKAFTPVCERELAAYAKDPLLARRVIAVSADDAALQGRFRDHVKASFAFVPDTEGKIGSAWGLKKSFGGRFERVSLVVGCDGRIHEIFRGMAAVDTSRVVGALSTASQACPPKSQGQPAKAGGVQGAT